MPERLIDKYEVKLASPDCHPTAEWFTVTVELEDDISEVLPYLNAELAQPKDYRPKDKVMLWESSPKRYAFRPKEIAITPASDNAEAQTLVKNIVQTVNDIWERKDQITPSFEEKAPLPKVLDIYKMLPRSNCKKCGFPTCMAFSTELRTDFSKLSLCPHLSEEDFKKVL